MQVAFCPEGLSHGVFYLSSSQEARADAGQAVGLCTGPRPTPALLCSKVGAGGRHWQGTWGCKGNRSGCSSGAGSQLLSVLVSNKVTQRV